ncbi:MAG: nicotinamide-nucleotide adenylyltransferase [Candidatus Thermoplasmatota archaeon]|nr:nicotinamide-nucleotide adenylyltransferase [Candidatus Thermoplasmatota archaeon]
MAHASVFIGRFQPFHLGHYAMITHCNTDTLYIGIGSSQYHHLLKNPFTYDERKTMIQLALQNRLNIEYDIYGIPDIHDPPNWVDHVKRILPPFTTVITNNDFTAGLFKERGYQIQRPGLIKRNKYAGKIIREHMINEQKWQHLVPKEVAIYLEKINASDRIKTLFKDYKKH